MDQQHIQNLRQDYKLSALCIKDVDQDPVVQFENWFAEAEKHHVHEPNAMTLATADAEGRPSARIVLLKGFSKNGFVFYTNYNSHKSLDLAENPFAALVFFWGEMERQIRIEGKVQKVSDADSDQYFQSRPKGSQLGALASPQSSVIFGRAELELRLTELKKKYTAKEVKRPENWGGYIVAPELVEFWQGRSNRLHDRIQYRLVSGNWIMERLAP